MIISLIGSGPGRQGTATRQLLHAGGGHFRPPAGPTEALGMTVPEAAGQRG